MPPPGSRPGGGPAWAAGPVTRLSTPDPGPPGPPGLPGPVPPDRSGRDRRLLWWFGGAAGVLLAAGLAVVLAVVLGGGDIDPFRADPDRPVDVRPPLARMCPPPASPAPEAAPPAAPGPSAEPDPAPGGARTVDEEAGISYAAYGPPWQSWERTWNAGSLQVPYKVGQHFITEAEYNGFSDYHASILSAAVPAAVNDSMVLDLECVGRRVASDVRGEYYPQPNRMELLRDERTTLAGRPAWVTVFRLHFSLPGLRATSELAGVACIDMGGPTAAILYVSIPDTHRQFDHVVEDTLASVRPA
nr:hypothetical protein [Micromonospora sp. DSM 115978]